MINDTTSKLFKSLEQTFAELLHLLSSANTEQINTIAFKDSWTPAQVVSHLVKSNNAIAQSLLMPGKNVERDPGERNAELKKMFLDYTTKYQSPEFIRPSLDIYQMDILMADLKKSMEHLRKEGNTVNLSEIISLPAFGEITKYELLHFVLYHTQRHIQQLKKIYQVIQEKRSLNVNNQFI
ncbi:MAG: DinB family protein [Ginsengibacter sp.]